MENGNDEHNPRTRMDESPFDIDSVDIPPKNIQVSNLDIFFLISSIFMHIIDIGIDVNLAVRYLLAYKMEYFAWTVSFILIPSSINVIVSKRMQQQDRQTEEGIDHPENCKLGRLITRRKACCTLATIFQLAPVIRYYDTLMLALKSRERERQGDHCGQRRYYLKMLKEDQDVALLRLFECFLEAAPQQILQITILLKNYHARVNLEFLHQLASVLSSLGSMGWAMASYNRSIRLAQHDKSNIGTAGTIAQFIWHFGVTVSRVISVSVVASLWPLYAGIACICHWFGTTVCIMIDSQGMLQFCRNPKRAPHALPTIKERIQTLLLAAVIGVVHVFVYLNVVDGSTLLKHALFYIVCFAENITATTFWILWSSDEVKNAWYFELLIVLSIVPFLLGTTAMVLYYTVFHPSEKR